MKTAILPTPGDPILVQYWLAHYKRAAEHIDQLQVLINTSAFEEDYIHDLARLLTESVNATVHIIEGNVSHGILMNWVLNHELGDDLLFLEDDMFIIDGKYVKYGFDLLSEYVMVGSPRGGYSPTIEKLGKEAYGEIESSRYDNGLGMWPAMLFIRRNTIEFVKDDLPVNGWQTGEKVPGLNYVVEEDIERCDTFTRAAVKLRSLFHNEIYNIPQFHTHPYEETDSQYMQYLEDAPYIHIGSLSSGVDGLIQDNFGRPLNMRRVREKGERNFAAPQTEMEKLEMEKRIAVWMLALDWHFKNGLSSFNNFATEYGEGLKALIEINNLKIGRILHRMKFYKSHGML